MTPDASSSRPHVVGREDELSRLDAFLKHIAGRATVAFEFRHASWFGDELFECLRAHSAVLCITDCEDSPQMDFVRTADWGYVRVRDEGYTDERLHEWIKRIRSHQWALESYIVGNGFRDPAKLEIFRQACGLGQTA